MGKSNGYQLYRRRADGPVHEEQDCTWVVPHNTRLLCRYSCHLNVEVCSSIKAVKYLFKYTYKGRTVHN